MKTLVIFCALFALACAGIVVYDEDAPNYKIKIEEVEDSQEMPLGNLQFWGKCKICEKVLNTMGEFIHGSSEALIKHNAEKVCLFFGPLRGKCLEFVDQNFERMYQMLKGGHSAHEVCAAIHVCHRVQNEEYESNDQSEFF